MDGEHRIAEAVELHARFGFGRLDHHGSADRERHRWRVVAKVHQALGDVGHFDSGVALERTAVEYHFMRGAAVFTRVQNGVRSLEAELHVVRIQNGHLRAVGQAFAAEHLDVSV